MAMDLKDLITEGVGTKPPLVCVYGEPGVGKTTLVKPCFTIDLEGGADRVGGRRMRVRTWPDLLGILDALRAGQVQAAHVAIDTVDAAADMATVAVLERHQTESLNDGSLGYGRGADVLAGEFRKLLRACELLERPVYLLAHSLVKRFEDPMIGAYDRFVPNLPPRLWDLVWRHADAVLFARYVLGARKASNGKVQAIVSDDARELLTVKGSGYEAKNRFGLPTRLPLDWGALQEAMVASAATPADIRTRIAALLPAVPEDKRDAARAFVLDAGDDVVRLRAAETRLREIGGAA